MNPDKLLSAHARYAAHAAAACGYTFRSLDGADGYLFEVRDGARRALFAAGQGSPYALNDANAASLARDKWFCAEALRAANLPGLAGRLFFVTKRWSEMRSPGREPEDARAFAETAAYPIFCKPISASNGLHAEIIDDAAAFEDYMQRVAREHFAILAQPYVRGAEHRVFVLNGRALFSYRKHQPSIVGDGRSTLGELLASAEILGKRNARDESGALLIHDAVPARGVRISVEGPANRSAGGGSANLADGAPAPLAQLAIKAADALGLKLAGVDIFDVSPAHDLGELVIIEVNSNPMIATLEDHNRWDLIDTIWRANFEAALR
jgi:glutathione synthase/RimK-type ligase-like ATP-grasp enzyme